MHKACIFSGLGFLVAFFFYYWFEWAEESKKSNLNYFQVLLDSNFLCTKYIIETEIQHLSIFIILIFICLDYNKTKR